jgi:NAD(P)-dependent dehydrogenase (short-subunit alcohol dehydrogenase family)
MATAEISDLLSVTLEGAIRMAVGIGRGMLARGRGVVLNISSQHAFVGAEGRAIYAATKAAMVQFTRSSAAEWGRSGVRVVGLAPGPVESPMTADALKSDEYRRAFLERIPIGRFLSCDEIAEVAFQLCRPGMAAILGHTVLADGGCSLT